MVVGLLLLALAWLWWRDYRETPPSEYDPDQHDALHYRYRSHLPKK